MIRHSLCFMLVTLYVICGSAFCQLSSDHDVKPDQVKAVSIDAIITLGIITNGSQRCDSTTPIDVFADPELTVKIGSIANHSIVRYDRLSVLTGKPYWSPRREYALPDGEKFKIHGDSIAGWVDDEHLMTFSSTWRERNTAEYFAVDGNTAVCLYSSGQYETPACVALTIWEKTNFEQIWVLRAIEYDPVKIWLYSLLTIDGLVRYEHENLAIRVSARGGDAEEAWGSFAFYLYQDTALIKSLEKDYFYRSDRDYSTLDCELTLDEKGEPIVLMIQKHYVIDDLSVPGYPSSLSATDTTVVQLHE
jgi:hypothetical protein